MLKTINGFEVMTGTSEGSQYPVHFWFKNGVHIGVQIHLSHSKSNPGLLAYGLYARAQMFHNGEDIEPSFKAMFEACRKLPLNMRGPKHMSGQLIGIPFDLMKFEGGTDPKSVAKKIGEAHRNIIAKVAKEIGATKLKDEYLEQLGYEAYLKFVNYQETPSADKELEEIEKLDNQVSDTFDFLNMIGKPNPDA